ncbi:MAG: PL29 family lyase N-terminal domain-containing protein [Porphyromonas sp.]|nr:PL29 family lyase N-terminal domain-containing protein [Porphyromonas sp.]
MKMKTVTSLLCTFAMLFAFSSCVNLDEINDRLDKHEERLKNLEQMITSSNETIANLQKLIDAEQKKLTITSFVEIDGGYELLMSDGSKITLKDGNDGAAPLIGVKAEDGVLYWTINGEYMLDADGQKIKAEGADGTNGIAPQIRVDREGYWEISVDEGKTWQALLDENGEKVKAEGSDATVDLDIQEVDGQIIITYNGQTFIIPKGNDDETPEEPVLEGMQFDEVSGRYYGNWFNALADNGALTFTWSNPDDASHTETLEVPFNMNKLLDYNVSIPKLEAGVYNVVPRPFPSYNVIPMTLPQGDVIDFWGSVMVSGTYLKVNKNGEETYQTMVEGEMTVSYGGDDVTVVFDFVTGDSQEFRGYYTGSLDLLNKNDNDEAMPARPWTTLTEDKTLNFLSDAEAQINIKGKSVLPDVNSWVLMIGSPTPGDFLMVEFFSGTGDEKEPAEGTYTISKELKSGTILAGHKNFARDLIYSWFADMTTSVGDDLPTTVAPLTEGTMTITKSEDIYTFTFDFKDDASGTPHAIKGEWTGTVTFEQE